MLLFPLLGMSLEHHNHYHIKSAGSMTAIVMRPEARAGAHCRKADQ